MGTEVKVKRLFSLRPHSWLISEVVKATDDRLQSRGNQYARTALQYAGYTAPIAIGPVYLYRPIHTADHIMKQVTSSYIITQ